MIRLLIFVAELTSGWDRRFLRERFSIAERAGRRKTTSTPVVGICLSGCFNMPPDSVRPPCPADLREFRRQFASEEACQQYLAASRWPDGFRCPRCGHQRAYPMLWACPGNFSERVFFGLFKGSSFDLYATLADGSGEHELLFESDHDQLPMEVSSDGRFAAIWEVNPDSGDDIHILSLDGDGAAVPFLTTPASERDRSFSPDGRYLAYSSNVSGRYEVYVAKVSGAGGRTTISTSGGRWPHWSAGGDELLYLSGSTMMAVSVTLEPTFEAGTAEPLFEGAFEQWYDVSPDGSFVMLTEPSAELNEINVIMNWLSELAQRVPTN